MSIALLCQDCAETGQDVCFSIFHRTLVEQSIEEGHRVAIILHGNSPPPPTISSGRSIDVLLHIRPGDALVLGLGGRLMIVF
jgi:hypothetical protein